MTTKEKHKPKLLKVLKPVGKKLPIKNESPENKLTKKNQEWNQENLRNRKNGKQKKFHL